MDWSSAEQSMRHVMRHGGSQVLDHPRAGYVQWADAPGRRLHVEVSDGGDYDTAMSRTAVAEFADAGWGRPDGAVRNCWFQVTDESEIGDAMRLVRSAWDVLDRLPSHEPRALPSRAIVGQPTRSAIVDAQAVLAAVTAAADAQHRCARELHSAWDAMVASVLRAQLASLDLDTIKKLGPSGMRMAALRRAGATTVLDVYDLSETQLERVPGVGAHTSRAAKATATAIANELARIYRVSELDGHNPAHQPVLAAAYQALLVSDLVTDLSEELDALRTRLPELVAAARPATGRIRLWLAGKHRRDEALRAAQEVSDALAWVVGAGVAQALDSVLRLEGGRAQVRHALEDFSRRPSAYHAAVAGLPGWNGPRPAEPSLISSAGVTGRGQRSSHGTPTDWPWLARRVDTPHDSNEATPAELPEPPLEVDNVRRGDPSVADEAEVSRRPEPGPLLPEPEPPPLVPPTHTVADPPALSLAGLVSVALASGPRLAAIQDAGLERDAVRSLVETLDDRPGNSLSTADAAAVLGVAESEVPACVRQLQFVLNAPGHVGLAFDRVSHRVVLDPGEVERALTEDVSGE